MVYKILTVVLAVATFGAFSSAPLSSAYAADEFGKRFTNQTPAALSGESAVNSQDLVAQTDDDIDAFADALNEIMPAAGDNEPVVIDTDVNQFFKKKSKSVSEDAIKE